MGSTDDTGAPAGVDSSDTAESPSVEVNESKTSAEANAAKSSVHPGDVRRVLGRKPSGNAKRSGNCVRWQVSTASRGSSRAPTDSDAWGGADVNASSQLAPPPKTPSSPSPFDELDHWSTPSSSSRPVDHFDLFGTHDGATTTTDLKANPFNAQYDPFADIWAEDEDHHFW